MGTAQPALLLNTPINMVVNVNILLQVTVHTRLYDNHSEVSPTKFVIRFARNIKFRLVMNDIVFKEAIDYYLPVI